MQQWASVIGLALTALGVLVGFYLPTVPGIWGGPAIEQKQRWLRVRTGTGAALVTIGTVLQIYAALPSGQVFKADYGRYQLSSSPLTVLDTKSGALWVARSDGKGGTAMARMRYMTDDGVLRTLPSAAAPGLPIQEWSDAELRDAFERSGPGASPK